MDPVSSRKFISTYRNSEEVSWISRIEVTDTGMDFGYCAARKVYTI